MVSRTDLFSYHGRPGSVSKSPSESCQRLISIRMSISMSPVPPRAVCIASAFYRFEIMRILQETKCPETARIRIAICADSSYRTWVEESDGKMSMHSPAAFSSCTPTA